jgi:hypothetical protein
MKFRSNSICTMFTSDRRGEACNGFPTWRPTGSLEAFVFALESHVRVRLLEALWKMILHDDISVCTLCRPVGFTLALGVATLMHNC